MSHKDSTFFRQRMKLVMMERMLLSGFVTRYSSCPNNNFVLQFPIEIIFSCYNIFCC